MSGEVTPIVALDVSTTRDAIQLIEALGDLCRFYKVGTELFTAAGPAAVHVVRERGSDVFLDLKFHDIPNTVRGAVRNAAAHGVRLVTVHASGGAAMLEAAAAGARDATNPAGCGVLAVTALTSMDTQALSHVWGRPIHDMEAEVLRLAKLAAHARLHGVVCSGKEAGAVRARFAEKLATLVPGVRLSGGDAQDQSRVVTPREAADAGARYIVVGRAVTAAKSPADAMRQVLLDLS
jgi:orotidine-5'-phosphate decarboxylase